MLPLYGVLQPGESQPVQMTFYGHQEVCAEVIAACRVEGGPTYEVPLVGEAASVEYRFDRTTADVGNVVSIIPPWLW